MKLSIKCQWQKFHDETLTWYYGNKAYSILGYWPGDNPYSDVNQV